MWRRPAATLSGLLVLAMAGCAGPAYTFRNLPPEFLAAKTENIGQTGLSNLHVPPVDSRLIDIGDVLEVTIITTFKEVTSTTTPARVERDGTANIPLIGRVALAGLELDEAEQMIAATAVENRVFHNPHVVVEMKRKYLNKITVIGAVPNQGEFKLTRDASSLLGALVAAGGLSEDAGPEVIIRRARHGGAPYPPWPQERLAGGSQIERASYETGGVQITRVNLTAAAAEGGGGGTLEDGDVVIVTRRIPQPINVSGLVRTPGTYELPPNHDTRVLDALAMAGGRTLQVADRVIVIRRIEGEEEPVMILVSVRQAKSNGDANIVLAPGDNVMVEETPVTLVVSAITNVIRIGIGGTVGFF